MLKRKIQKAILDYFQSDSNKILIIDGVSGMRDRNSLGITLNSTFWKTRTGNGFLKI